MGEQEVYEYAAECHFIDGTRLLDGKRFATFAGADHCAATIRAQYPPQDVPESGDLKRVAVVRRRVGGWEPADG